MTRCKITVLVIFLALGPYITAEETEAPASFQQPDEHINWLSRNIDHPDYMLVLHAYIDSEKNIGRIISGLRDLVLLHPGSSYHPQLFLLLARYEEHAGMLKEAQQHYELAGMLAADEEGREALLDSIRLLIEMGKYERAQTQAQAYINVTENSTLKRYANVLLCTALYAGGEYAEAQTVFTVLTTEPEGLKSFGPQELFPLIQVALGTGRTERAEQLTQVLTEQYPESPETFLLQNKLIVQLETNPFHLLTFASTDEPDAGGREGKKDGDVRIQTGLFSNRENAVELRQTLAAKGFKTVITEIVRGGKTFYRVLSEPVSLQDSQEYIIRLKEYGYEGFLVFDSPG